MGTILIIIGVWICLSNVGEVSSTRTVNSVRNHPQKGRKLSRRERKRIRKAMERAEMDAFENQYMIFESFMDD
ncbi:MAG: hypothetical protein J5518_04860 [Lachnospiraceae bacterium]|nr:hypothetical protein [Lachnospiraceae bacterium]